MPRKTSDAATEEVETPSRSPNAILDEKLDTIIAYMHRAERRDRIRSLGAFVHSMFSLIPILLLIWSAVYFYQHGTDLIKQITSEAVRQSAEYTQDSLMDQFNNYIQPRQ
jgi:hypothetical protein